MTDKDKKPTTVGSYGKVTEPALKYTPKRNEKTVLDKNIDFFATCGTEDTMDEVLDALSDSLKYIKERLELLDKRLDELDKRTGTQIGDISQGEVGTTKDA